MGDFMSLDSPEELSKFDDLMSEEEEFDEMGYINNSSVYDEIIENGFHDLKKKKKKPKPKNKVKRPLNPFMLWLKDERIKIKEKEEKRRKKRKVIDSPGDFLRDLSAKWKSLSEEEKKPYGDEAQRLKEIHRKENPNYIYQPNRRSTAKTPAVKRNATNEYEDLSSEIKPKTKTAFKGYFCKKCLLGFYLKSNLYKHLKYYHPDDPSESKQ